ncbi:hypothetical protein CXF83_04265 [Shewanella sp. Choline-02u-19]|uniref:YgiW/YdeI family stress tolerance OB fold protein n=1 Tax=unclassified Shewanella TaxID=196818 RepID=UPI000C31B90D|nr:MULTISPECIES: NirD/YgiW/YdeI family stress tolerance protein [unclassified Shewanella]PKH60322.1 hypothetical protein CXF84_02630 [Shewanella sp. Bg11-22]PKI29871.1 hypothetical protein CXF83_04265 [Shewanella sp. Choline-02u-19]
MKKLISILLISMLSSTVSAEFIGTGSSSGASSVKSIASMSDDQYVTLEGYLVKQIRSEHYIFKDATGEVEVEIDHEELNGIAVTPSTKIRIAGEIDKEWTKTVVDVHHLALAQ